MMDIQFFTQSLFGYAAMLALVAIALAGFASLNKPIGAIVFTPELTALPIWMIDTDSVLGHPQTEALYIAEHVVAATQATREAFEDCAAISARGLYSVVVRVICSLLESAQVNIVALDTAIVTFLSKKPGGAHQGLAAAIATHLNLRIALAWLAYSVRIGAFFVTAKILLPFDFVRIALEQFAAMGTWDFNNSAGGSSVGRMARDRAEIAFISQGNGTRSADHIAAMGAGHFDCIAGRHRKLLLDGLTVLAKGTPKAQQESGNNIRLYVFGQAVRVPLARTIVPQIGGLS